MIQYWFTEIALAASLPAEVRAQMDADLAMSRRDVEAAAAASVPVIVSPLNHCYLDVPYAEPSADPAQAERQGRVGLRLYAPMTVAEAFHWEPAEVLGAGRAAQVAGVEAAVWAETVADFDDLSFLLLPRLAGVADKAWSDPRVATWTGHRERLARKAGCGPRTTSPTSAPPPWTGSSLARRPGPRPGPAAVSQSTTAR